MSYVTQAAATSATAAAHPRPLVTTPMGLASGNQSTSESSPPTTGLAGGLVSTSFPLTMDVNGTVVRVADSVIAGTVGRMIGGLLVVEGLAAGTYDFSVQFKSSSGSVTVSDRKLRVWTVGY